VKTLTRQEWYGALVAVLVLGVLLSIASPYFLTTGNLSNILVQASVIALLAGGQTFVILTGGVDLAVGALTALAGAIAGHLMIKLGVNPYAAMVAALAIGAAVGLFIGYGNLLGVPMPIWITGIFFVVMAFILSSTKLGRYVFAMGSNEMGARQVGINIRWYKLSVYVVSGLSCALGAIVLMARMDSSSGKMAQMFELDAIAAVILGGTSLFGGRGSLWGSLLGAVLITMIRNGMNLMEISQFKQMMAIGAVVIIAVWIDVLRRQHLLKK
jgi:ribose transport system permease protein